MTYTSYITFYLFTTILFSTGFVQIQNIKAEFINNNSSLLITWDYSDNKHDIPMTYIVKYKVIDLYSLRNDVIPIKLT